jgi:hypothetical protein
MVTAEETCRFAAWESLRDGAWKAAATSLSEEEILAFVSACIAAARGDTSTQSQAAQTLLVGKHPRRDGPTVALHD